VYTVGKGTLVEGETTNPEAVGSEFTKMGDLIEKESVSLV